MSRPRAVLVALVVGVLLTALTACEPKSPDRAEWRDDAYYAVSGTASDVATATLAIRQLAAGQVFGNYAQVALIAAEDDAGKQAQKFGALQPAPVDTARFHQVTSALSDAGDVLTDVRIAVVRRKTSTYDALLKRLAAQTKALDKVETALGGLRGKP